MRHRVLPSVILAVVALLLTIAVTVGWNIIFASHFQHAFDLTDSTAFKVGYWLVMGLGDLFLAGVMAAIGVFLGVAIRRSRQLHQQDAFVDRITHELRTPVAALRLSVDTLQRCKLSPQEIDDQYDEMLGDLDRLQDLIDHVIDAGRIEHGEWRPRVEVFDLVEMVAGCIKRVTARHELAGDEINLDVVNENSDLQSFSNDRIAVEHIILNLLDNAVKYSKGTPSVSIRLSQEYDSLICVVSDQGVGIAKHEMARVFKRFHRVAQVPTSGMQSRSRHGTGLGLYVVAQLCRQLGGTVDVDSPGLDLGSTFTVRLPFLENG